MMSGSLSVQWTMLQILDGLVLINLHIVKIIMRSWLLCSGAAALRWETICSCNTLWRTVALVFELFAYSPATLCQNMWSNSLSAACSTGRCDSMCVVPQQTDPVVLLDHFLFSGSVDSNRWYPLLLGHDWIRGLRSGLLIWGKLLWVDKPSWHNVWKRNQQHNMWHCLSGTSALSYLFKGGGFPL